jgi:hypothetical protein
VEASLGYIPSINKQTNKQKLTSTLKILARCVCDKVKLITLPCDSNIVSIFKNTFMHTQIKREVDQKRKPLLTNAKKV